MTWSRNTVGVHPIHREVGRGGDGGVWNGDRVSLPTPNVMRGRIERDNDIPSCSYVSSGNLTTVCFVFDSRE